MHRCPADQAILDKKTIEQSELLHDLIVSSREFRQSDYSEELRRTMEKYTVAVEKMLEEVPCNQTNAMIFEKIGQGQLEMKEPEKAIVYFKKELLHRQFCDDEMHEGVALFKIGLCLEMMEDNEKCIAYMNMARKVFERHNANDLKASVYLSLGVVYSKLAQHAKTLARDHKMAEHLENAIAMFSLAKDTDDIDGDFKRRLNHDLAMAHSELGVYYNSTKKNFEMAAKAYETNEDFEMAAKAYENAMYANIVEIENNKIKNPSPSQKSI
jgi:tetratricopeptide (TPR) repeat protein